jgi:sugar phosphate isomerase/epimerase
MFKNLNLGAIGHNAPFDAACTLAKAHGFPGIDLDMGDLMKRAQATSAGAARDWFLSQGLKPGAAFCSARWREGDDEAAFEASLKQQAEEAALAASVGCTRSATWVMPASNTLDFRAHWALVTTRLTRVARVLGEHGLRLGLEFIGPATLRAQFKHGFVHSMDAMLGLCAAIGPNAGLLLDCFHGYTAHVTADDLGKLSNRDVVYVHVNDAIAGRGPDGQIDLERDMVTATGVIDIGAFMRALRAIGYDGPVTVEPFSNRVKAMPIADAVALTGASLDKAFAA